MKMKFRLMVEVIDEMGRRRWLQGPLHQIEVSEQVLIDQFAEAALQGLREGGDLAASPHKMRRP